MNCTVQYNAFPNGIITPVSSKSISNRALIIHALTRFSCKLNNLSESEDTQTMLQLLEKYRLAGERVELNAGMAGTVMRFLAVFCSVGEKEVLLTGSARMLQRPMKELVETLRHTGADITYAGEEGYAPLLIRPAKIKGGKLSIDAGVSSQFITALMLCGPYLENGLQLELKGETVSYSYILLTKSVMEIFGAEVQIESNIITVTQKPYRPQTYTIEGDWSSAAYFYALLALSEKGEIGLRQMNLHSLQGDRAIVDMAKQFGVETVVFDEGIVIRKKEQKIPGIIHEDFLLCPDLAQTMSTMCAGNKTASVYLSGLRTLKGKETDRVQAIQNELEQFGVRFHQMTDDAFGFDASGFHASLSAVKTYHDHRMAMSFAPLAQKTGTLTIEDAQVVQKSYPRFWEDLKTLGCLVENTDI